MARARVLLLLFFLPASAAFAADDLDKRTAALADELRCLVCQNQTLADSHAPLAIDLRNQIREQLAGGKSEREVREFMVARYGDFVLYRPPFKASTVALWGGPLAFLLLGIFILVRRLARRRVSAPSLSEAERERAAKLLPLARELAAHG